MGSSLLKESLCRFCSDLICSFKLGVKLAEDLVQFLADDVRQHIQSAPERETREETFKQMYTHEYQQRH